MSSSIKYAHMKQTEPPVISFLIPLYNCGKTIEKCISSITSQFKEDYPYEIVVVNDGSTDNGTDILNDLISKGDNIRLYNQVNHGVSYTRQRLLEYAGGKYIMFVDADDYLVDGVVVNLLNGIEKSDADAICFQFIYGDSARTEFNISVKPKFQEHSASEFVNQFDFNGLVPLWRFIFKRSSITEKFEPYIEVAEDLIFLVKQLPKMKKVISTNTVGYVYCENVNSLTRNSDKQIFVKRSKSYADAAIRLSKICRDKGQLLPANVYKDLAGKINYFSYISIAQCIMGGAI